MNDFLTSHDEIVETKIAPESGTVFIGTVKEIDDQGAALVDFPDNPEDVAIKALSTVSITKQHISRQVAILFNGGDFKQPVIMGLIHSPLDSVLETFELSQDTPEAETDIGDALVDGKRVVIEGKEEIVLKCGEASITLTKAGKILIRGKYLLNRSSGVNRIMGGSVQVN
ncbi:MAG: hypothetical protein DIZ80_06930 [endosymbiont of Galathealinum brachiosum]|uniref:DUF6484 domain-containing protein n=1 Tax=endosymbiont of Galathealinum brachiosum TaxID=2200906 RepID=A0A370DG35_9GAMM|nr:MAG: hypothetical protein DIZ80_06930 [endosymbiont of Galathealinum brachiosum]